MLAHSNTLAWALFHASLFHLLRRDLAAAEGLAGELIAIARKQGALFWATRGRPILILLANSGAGWLHHEPDEGGLTRSRKRRAGEPGAEPHKVHRGRR
jgi:hypothetical protein